jgi:hypothetical protein
MHRKSKLACAVIGASLLAAAASLATSAPTWAQEASVNQWGPALSSYRGPDGTYDSLADFLRDRAGTPCGINCTRAAQERWARYFAQHPYRR